MSPENDFPNDENGQVLKYMAESGVDLSVPREIDFSHLAPDEPAARGLAAEATELGFKVEVYEPDEESLEEGDTDYDVVCNMTMVPSHAEITRIEAQLAEIAARHGCQADGWGFMC